MTGIIVGLGALAVLAAGGPLQGWVVPSTQKVYPDTMPPEKAQAVDVYAARGEYEAVQLALRSDVDIPEVRLALAPSTRSKAALLSPRWVEMFDEVYLATPADKAHPRTPDPLVPIGDKGISLIAGETRAVWVRIKVPEAAEAGTYSADVLAGEFMLVDGVYRNEKGPFVRRPIKLTVWPFTLPRKTHARTAFGLDGTSVLRAHGLKEGTPEAAAMVAKYLDALVDHRLCSYSIPYGFGDPRGQKYLRSERVNSFTIPFTEDGAQLAETWRLVQDLGAGAKAWVYPSDEPVGKAQYEGLKKQCALVHRVAPGLKTCSPFFRGPDWDEKLTPFDELIGSLDIWCCNTGYYNNPNIQRLMAERQKAGEEAWWYVCCGPGKPFGNYFVDMSAIEHRILTWQMFKYGITGLLYWSTSYWSGTKDPWDDIATVKDINPNIYGDGSLFYPGKHVGIDGPVTSIRLECIRDSMEDYEYLVMARRAIGEERTQAIVSKMTTNLVEYETDPVAFGKVRKELGDAIARAK